MSLINRIKSILTARRQHKNEVIIKKENKAVIDFQQARAANRAIYRLRQRNIEKTGETTEFFERRLKKSRKDRRKALNELIKRRNALKTNKTN